MTDHTRTEKIGGDSINFMVTQVVAGNRYDKIFSKNSDILLRKFLDQFYIWFIY